MAILHAQFLLYFWNTVLLRARFLQHFSCKSSCRPLQATGWRLQATGNKLQAAVQATGYKLQATGYKVQAAGCKLQSAGYKRQAAGNRLQATRYRPQVTDPLQATGYKLQATSHRLQASCLGFFPSIINCSANHSILIAFTKTYWWHFTLCEEGVRSTLWSNGLKIDMAMPHYRRENASHHELTIVLMTSSKFSDLPVKL